MFISVSEYYAGVMRSRLGLGPSRVRVVRPGIKLKDYPSVVASPDSPTIGYLSPLCDAKGLTDLIEAFAILRQRPGLAALRLRVAGERVAGGMRRADLRRQLAKDGLAEQVEILPEPKAGAKPEFLRSLTVLSVPTREPEAFGVHVLEALASGVPVVQPRHGAFEEMLELTGGGVLFEPGDVQALAAALEGVLTYPARARELGGRGREGVAEHFSSGRMAREMTRAFVAAGDGVFHHGDTEHTENGE
jgi:glycosyltransferase involved in cell wall biosynthesis